MKAILKATAYTFLIFGSFLVVVLGLVYYTKTTATILLTIFISSLIVTVWKDLYKSFKD